MMDDSAFVSLEEALERPKVGPTIYRDVMIVSGYPAGKNSRARFEVIEEYLRNLPQGRAYLVADHEDCSAERFLLFADSLAWERLCHIASPNRTYSAAYFCTRIMPVDSPTVLKETRQLSFA